MKQQMQDLKLTNESLSNYIKNLKKIFDGLVAIQKPVVDDDKVIDMFIGLESDYNALVISMRAKLPFSSYSQFVLVVQSYKLRLKRMSSQP